MEPSTDSSLPEGTIAIVLAAGSGSRFHGSEHKLLARLGNESARTVIESSLTNVLAAGFHRVVVITGAIRLPTDIVDHPRLVIAHNDEWRQGQASSLKLGIHTARELGATAVVVGLGDQPSIEPEAWRRVALSKASIAIATYGGERGHPVRLAENVWDQLSSHGDVGARDLIRRSPELVSQVDCPGSSIDIDTQEDLAQWT